MKSDFTQSPSGLILPDSENYPEDIRACIRQPMPLYYRGNIELLKPSLKLSVIGSRAVTASNERNIHHILDDITNPAICIVSGLAIGIDALAHEIALKNGLPTIAILGSSVETAEVYPRSNASLGEAIIASGGLLISPFPPGTDIMPYNFPIRNQFIASISASTIVVSAAQKSGALITARLALEYGKDVFVVPGTTFDPLYEGSNLLLQQGATPVLSANDILEYFKLAPGPKKAYATEDLLEQELILLLQQHECSVQELLIQLNIGSAALNTLLTKLELKGWINRLPDGSITLL